MKAHIADLLAITDGRLFRSHGFDSMWKLIDFVSGKQNFSHQLPQVADEIMPSLYRQHPWLREVVVPDFDESSSREVLAALVAQYGEWHEVEPIRWELS